MTPSREPETDAYVHRKALLMSLHADGILGDLLRAAFDRYRITAWSGNEVRGLRDAVGILKRGLATQDLDDELREMITLTIDELHSLQPSKRLKELSLRREGLMPADWPGFGDEGCPPPASRRRTHTSCQAREVTADQSSERLGGASLSGAELGCSCNVNLDGGWSCNDERWTRVAPRTYFEMAGLLTKSASTRHSDLA